MVVPVIVGEHGHAGLADPGLVEGGQLRAAACGGGRDGQLGGAHDGAAVGPEAYGVILRGAGEQLPVGHQDAQGVAGGGVVEIAVDGAHHPIALAFVFLHRVAHGAPAADGRAVGGHGPHAGCKDAVGVLVGIVVGVSVGIAVGAGVIPSVLAGEHPGGRLTGVRGGELGRISPGGGQVPADAGGVGEEVLVTGLVIAAAPEYVLAVGHALLQRGVPQPYVASIGAGRGPG